MGHGVNYQTGLECGRADAVGAVSINQAKGTRALERHSLGLPDWQDAVQNAYKALTHVQGVTCAQHLSAVVTLPRAMVETEKSDRGFLAE